MYTRFSSTLEEYSDREIAVTLSFVTEMGNEWLSDQFSLDLDTIDTL